MDYELEMGATIIIEISPIREILKNYIVVSAKEKKN